MYTSYFGLAEAPFQATPDPRFFYSNPVYREAYATLQYGVLERKGFIALTGRVGTGKTTLLRRLMDELGARVRFVLFYNTTLSFDETVEFICGELALAVDGLSRVQRLQRLNDLLIAEAGRGGTVALLIDEAQNLGHDVLENLRLISNLETSTEKLLQIVLVGQPQLNAKLADPALWQVAQRIAVRYHLKPLPDHEIGPFVRHRLQQCGRPRQDLFTADAIRRIGLYSNGVPRLINIVCDRALLHAFGADATRVSGAMIDEVAADLKLRPRARIPPAHAASNPAARATVPALERPGGRPALLPRGRALGWLLASAALVLSGAVAAVFPGSPLAHLCAPTPTAGVNQAGPPALRVSRPATRRRCRPGRRRTCGRTSG